jgi:hypothetical protein
MPLSLTDDEMNAVQAAAAPVHPLQRDAFLKALAAELEKHPAIGPGVVHRCAAELQKTLSWRRTVNRRSPPLRGRVRRGAEPAGRSQLLEPLALCNARLDRQQPGRET